MCDIDGDGVREQVEGLSQKLIAHDSLDGRIKPCWEVHLDDEHVIDDHEQRLGVAADFNGDGIEEIYFTTRTKDRSAWMFCVLDPAIPGVVLNTALPVGEDRRRPDFWDGYYAAEGVVEDADGQGNPGVILVRRVFYDASDRGICVVNPHNGQVIWEYVSGAQPADYPLLVCDLDNDGHSEIIYGTSSPGNLGSRKINGTGDNEIYLIVLSHRGRELMVEPIGGARFQGNVRAFDLDGDGVRELVTCTSNGNNGRTNELALWDWQTRSIIKRTRSTVNYYGLEVMAGPHPGQTHIFTGTDDGTILRYLYDGQTLKQDRQALQQLPEVWLTGKLDILPSPGRELIVELPKSGQTLLLDRDLNTLAIYSSKYNHRRNTAEIWTLGNSKKALVLSNTKSLSVLQFEKRPWELASFLVAWGLPVLGLALLAGFFYFGLITGQKRLSSSIISTPELATTTDYESLFRLRQTLEDLHHSVIGPAKGLERLVWLLDVFVTDLEVSDKLELRVRQILDDYLGEVGPRLYQILQLSEQASFEPGTVAETGRALDSLTSRISKLGDGPLNRDTVLQVRDALRNDWENLIAGFLMLRTAINKYFATDPVRLIQGLILVREGDFQREGITATLHDTVAATGKINCRIDNGDLRFVMDNLLDNATRAMKNRATRELTVQISRQDKEISLRVQDSGIGIEPDQQVAVFSSRFSSRSGGGRGLHRSREILERWGAEILLEESTPGQGTTFVIKLLAAEEQSSQRAMESQG